MDFLQLNEVGTLAIKRPLSVENDKARLLVVSNRYGVVVFATNDGIRTRDMMTECTGLIAKPANEFRQCLGDGVIDTDIVIALSAPARLLQLSGNERHLCVSVKGELLVFDLASLIQSSAAVSIYTHQLIIFSR